MKLRATTRLLLLLTALPAAGCSADARESSELYPAVEAILARSCAYERCHAGALAGAALDLSRGSDYWAALVDVPACEYERMARVEPGDPERSWLMIKLTADFRGPDDAYANYIYFEPESGWEDSRRSCPDRTEDGTPLFGQRMPATAPNMLPDAEIAAVRAWIEAGAPR